MRLFAFLALAILAVVQEGVARAAYQRRGASDVCGTVDGNLKVTFLGKLIPVGLIHVCLCVSGIPGFLHTNAVAATAVGLAGPGAVTAALEAMINGAGDHGKCQYPDNSEASCVPGAPCTFHCKNGFTPSPIIHPKDCICAFPFKVCNGICGPFKVCPSSGPHKRDLELERRVSCGAGTTACGVYGFQGFESAWECVDTQSDLESCGGCMVPLGKTPARGVDCTAIPGVEDVTCTAGACVVRRCQPGYVVSLDGQYCLRQDIQTEDIQTGLYALKQML